MSMAAKIWLFPLFCYDAALHIIVIFKFGPCSKLFYAETYIVLEF